MNKKIILTIIIMTISLWSFGKACACGSMESGTTFEYEVVGIEGVPCCESEATEQEGYILTWVSDGDGNYENTEISTASSATIQGKCCPSV